MTSFFRTYRTTRDGRRIDGVFLLAFIHNVDYHLTPISIFRDGMVDCWGLVTLAELKERGRCGWVVTQPPPDAKIRVSSLGSFTAVDPHYWIDPEELIKEIADEIEGLNGRPTARERCCAAWEAYQASPSEGAREALRTAYESVPAHNPKFLLGDQDRKDHPIRRVLYPEQYRR